MKVKSRLGSRGFTLIELVAVVAVISVLVLLGSPNFVNKIKDAKEVKIQSDIRIIEDMVDEKLAKDEVTFEDLGPPVAFDEIQDKINKGEVHDTTR